MDSDLSHFGRVSKHTVVAAANPLVLLVPWFPDRLSSHYPQCGRPRAKTNVAEIIRKGLTC
jgi:hypothetical protein